MKLYMKKDRKELIPKECEFIEILENNTIY